MNATVWPTGLYLLVLQLVRFQPDHFLPHSWLAPMYMDIACVLASEMPHVETIEMAANSVKESLSLPHLPDELHPLNYFNFSRDQLGGQS